MGATSFLAYNHFLPQGRELARTVVFSSIAVMTIVNQFNFKSLENNLIRLKWWDNKLVWISCAVLIPGLLALIYHPVLAEIF